MTKKYMVNEIFYSLQGEGMRAGTANVFVRFSKCNLKCSLETEGFDCDTEFASGRRMELSELIEEMAAAGPIGWCILTGGEPGLQVDDALLTELHFWGWKVAIETNGTIALPNGIDWITVSPKTAEHTLRQEFAHELKYVRRKGQGIPRPSDQRARAHKLISPAWGPDDLSNENLEWCVQLVKDNPDWRLSCQQHKWWRVR